MSSWFERLGPVFNSEWWKTTITTLMSYEASYSAVLPSAKIGDLCRALFDTPPDEVRVVIIGQDPYTGRWRDWIANKDRSYANGRAFAVSPSVPPQAWPKSLVNINKELRSDLNLTLEDGTLDRWASQGVMLLNVHLSTSDYPMAHERLNWPTLTSAVLKELNDMDRPIIFVAWGREAQAVVAKHVTNPRHPVVVGSHPSLQSASSGFFGTKPFSKINKHLKDMGQKPINWGKKA